VHSPLCQHSQHEVAFFGVPRTVRDAFSLDLGRKSPPG
jgi:hypothetical protein